MRVWATPRRRAGRGERLGEDRPKAFVAARRAALLAEPLRRLDESDWIDAIVVAVAAGWEEPAILLAEELAATKVCRGRHRRATRGGVSASCARRRCRRTRLVVVVHDAASRS